MKNQSEATGRIGFLTNTFTPYKEGLFRELAKLVDLKVYYCSRREKDRSWKVNFSDSYDYEVLAGTTVNLGNYHLHVNPSLPFAIKRDRIKLMIIGEYVYPTVMLAPFFCRAIKIPRILWCGSTLLEKKRRRGLSDLIKRLIIRQYDYYVAYTNRAAEYLNYLGADPEKIVVAPVTVDTDFFLRSSERLHANPGRETLKTRMGFHHSSVVVIFVGQMIHRKGGDVLLRAVARIKDPRVQVIMVGDGPLMGDWRKMAIDLGLEHQITWSGHVEQTDLARLYFLSDVMVLPSRSDPSGNVINEAMTVGLPVIISDRIGTDAVRHGIDGFIFASEDVDALAAALSELCGSSELRKKMGVAARINLLENFSIQKEASKFLEAVEKTFQSYQRMC